MSGGNIKVVVRCRPLNARELARGSKGLIQMNGNQTVLSPPDQAEASSNKSSTRRPMAFTFDRSYWSAGPHTDPAYAGQQTLYQDLGVEMLDHSFEGFNTCIFAYGQTGSGKSYSMMGYGADKGIVPLTTEELFRRVSEQTTKDASITYRVEVSYIEIYNEKVRDLLNPRNSGNLRVREHPSLGPYVEDLSRLVVENYGQMMTLMSEGNKARTVASTTMNETSSRSHAVFTVILTQKRHDGKSNMTGEKVSKISLVDLAGSERQASSGATGSRLKEGANINKSLTTLGKVIAALAQASSDPQAGKKKMERHIPYRDSVLTWLLKESLGGNSKTAMIAAISPADYEETLSTLRYADAAKKIKTHAVVNEDPNAKLIRELKEELEMLRSRVTSGATDDSSYDPSLSDEQQVVTLRTADGGIRRVNTTELQDQLQASEKLMASLNLTWEERLERTRAIHIEREQALEDLGITVDKGMVGVHAPQHHPSLVNLNEDPLMSECLVYQLRPGQTVIGSLESSNAQIRLSGFNILPEHCIFLNVDGRVSIESREDARTFVNGKRLAPHLPTQLVNGFRVILGDSHVFRYNDPAAARAQRIRMAATEGGVSGTVSGHDSPAPPVELLDWSAARREAADIAKMDNEDLDRLFEDIVRVRNLRSRGPESRDEGAIDRLTTTDDHSSENETNPWGKSGGMTTTTSYSFAYQPEEQPPISQRDPSGLALEEQDNMAWQGRVMARELKGVSAQASTGRGPEPTSCEPRQWNANELELVRRVVAKWRTFRTYKMAEQILTLAAELREANVISKQSGARVSYNLAVADTETADMGGPFDGLQGMIHLGASEEHIAPGAPSVRVKIIDEGANTVYTWDIPTFRHRLNGMRQSEALRSRPERTIHFDSKAPFVNRLSPTVSLIGSARFSLRLLLAGLSSTVTVPILCPYTMEAIGSCRIYLDSLPPSDTKGAQVRTYSTRLRQGSELSFSLKVDGVKGLSSADFDVLHAQTSLSSLLGPKHASDEAIMSPPINFSKAAASHVCLRHLVSTTVTSETVEHLENGWAHIHFFACLKPGYLSRLKRFDWHRELRQTEASAMPSRVIASPTAKPTMRRNETDFLSAEQHDVLATIEIQELDPDGDYTAVDVIDDIFQLHQGVQRRLGIHLKHFSNQALPWTGISHISMSDVRLVSDGGAHSVGKDTAQLVASPPVIETHLNGTCTMTTHCPWDSTAHGQSHLDRRTPSNQHFLIRLKFMVDIDNLNKPAAFSLDLPVRVLSRNSRRSSLRNLFSYTRLYTALTALFSVTCSPALARSAEELWQLDTAGKYVESAGILQDWRPRTLTVLEDYRRMTRTTQMFAHVQLTRFILNERDDIKPTKSGAEEEEALLRKCVHFWCSAVKYRVVLDLGPRQQEGLAISQGPKSILSDLGHKLSPTVKRVDSDARVIRSGYLMMVDGSFDHWQKVYCELSKQYLYVRPAPKERETMAINLSGAKTRVNEELWILMKQKYAFTIFARTNSYVLCAAALREMEEWCTVLNAVASG